MKSRCHLLLGRGAWGQLTAADQARLLVLVPGWQQHVTCRFGSAQVTRNGNSGLPHPAAWEPAIGGLPQGLFHGSWTAVWTRDVDLQRRRRSCHLVDKSFELCKLEEDDEASGQMFAICVRTL